MIKVRIGRESRRIEEAHKSWIINTIEGVRRDEGRVCVQVTIQMPQADFTLMTAACTRGYPVSRSLTTQESRLLELWRKLGLSENPDFEPQNVVTFLERAMRDLGALT